MKLLFLTLAFAFAVSIPTALCQGYDCQTGNVPDEDRRDCHPEPGNTESGCRARNCTYCPAQGNSRGIPSCFFNEPPSPSGYLMVDEPITLPGGAGYKVNLAIDPESNKRDVSRKWESEAQSLTLEALFESNSRLRIKITQPGTNRWEVPLEILPPSESNSNPLYEITFSNSPLFSFSVIRKSTGTVLIEAGGGLGKFIFAEQYLTLSWKPPTENVYGLGENEQPSFKHDFSRNLTWGLWARDQAVGASFLGNLYGVQPYYTVLESDGKAHSVAIINSNAQEFTLSQGPLIKYTTVGGILDFYFFLGPTPENTVQQYTEAVGRAPIPPYWSLGFHLCRYGYNTIESMKAAVDRTTQYQIPYDVQYGDIDIMERELDFTYSKDRFAGLPDYVKQLKTRGIKFITILDPCISIGEPAGTYRPFDYGVELGNDIWMKRADGSNAVGRVWPDDPVYFPDYSHPKTREWWITLIVEFHELLEYDAIWIDMNEPANFVTGDVNGCNVSKWNNPPYTPRISGNLQTMTVCPDNTDFVGRHYDTHSLFGWFESEPTLAAVRAGTGKRSLVLSRSTFLGSGRWTAHWLGDNYSRWSNLHFSIIGMLQFNQFGIPFVGPDICGHNGNTTPEQCQRWHELGAFYPFSRNHNGNGYIDQDPGAFSPEIAESTRTALLIRYTLLPFLYTLFYQHYVNGNTVARPLWHEFPTDSNTVDIDKQFMWGSALLISPVLDEGVEQVLAYFPNARIYDYYEGRESLTKGEYVTISAPMDFIPLHILGGNIVPTQEPGVNTEIGRNNPMGLIVALDEFNSAFGSLYFDDGDSIDPVENGRYFYAIYSAANRQIRSQVVQDGYPDMTNKVLNMIRLLGPGTVSSITVNGLPHMDFSTLPSGEVVIRNLGIGANSVFVITY